MKGNVRSFGFVIGVCIAAVPGIVLGEEGGVVPLLEEKGEGGKVSVAIEPTMPDAEATQGWVEERAQQVVEDLQWPSEEEGRLLVRISGTPYDYGIEVSAWWRGELLPAKYQPQGSECECDSDAMLDQVGEAVRAGATALAEVAEQERLDEARERAREVAEKRKAAEAKAKAKAKADVARAAALEAERPVPYRPGRLGSYGVGIGSVGALMAISGSIMAARGNPEPEGAWRERRDISGAGLAVLGVGSAVLIGGFSAVIVDAVRCRRKPARCNGVEGKGRWAQRNGGVMEGSR